MYFTSGTKVTVLVSAVVVLAGLAVVLHGIVYADLSHSIGGLGIAMTGLCVMALAVIRHWVTNTCAERRALAEAQDKAQAERSSYIAEKALLENERGRLSRDVATERSRIATLIKAERAAYIREFEERRATLISETMEATFLMIRDGKFAPTQSGNGTLIHFPNQHQQPARERSREHGAVHP